MDVMIYGLNKKTEFVLNKIKKNHRVIGIVERTLKYKRYKNFKVYSLEEIKELNYKYIILAIDDEKATTVIKKYLEIKFNIPEEKIIDFYHLYRNGVSSQKVDRVMQNPNNKNGFDGIVLGVSHSALGINPKYLSHNFCNLAGSSQDIFYNMKILEHCIENYYEKIKNLKYAVLDIFDYNYLNYDVSLTSDMINYLSWGGYNLDYHNYSRNKNFKLSIEEELKKVNFKIIKPLKKEEQNIRDLLFREFYENDQMKMFKDFSSPEQRCEYVEKDTNDYCMPSNMPKYGSNRYEKTIKENKDYFERTLDLLYKINPQIKIYGVIIPRYETVEKSHKEKYAHWKKEYEEYIKKLQKIYKFKYLNFKEIEEGIMISKNNEYYQDVAHLNYNGATAFTKVLNKYIDY